MYTEQDYAANRKQLRTRLTVLGIPGFILLAVVVWSFIIRIKWLTMLATCVLGVGCLFCYGMLLFPIIAYGKHMHELLHGRTHQLTGAFKEMGADRMLRDGVEFFPVIINVGKMDNPEDDRLLYYDANLTLPVWQIGDKLTFTVHDKSIGKWEAVQ